MLAVYAPPGGAVSGAAGALAAVLVAELEVPPLPLLLDPHAAIDTAAKMSVALIALAMVKLPGRVGRASS
jgi:hypothetical protein